MQTVVRSPSFFLLLLLPLLSSARVCSVLEFGARGDNVTEDTTAIQRAIDATIAPSGAPLCDVVVLPSGNVFLSRPIYLTSMSNRTLRIEGVLAAWRNISTWDEGSRNVPPPIFGLIPLIGPADNTTLVNLTITGGGTIEGGGFRWWYKGLKDDRPILIGLPLVSHFAMSNLTLLDSPFWNMGIRGDHILIEDMTIVALGESCKGFYSAPNTDGFNLGGQHIHVRNSYVHNGDDCTPITTSGIASAPDTFDVLVEDVECHCGTNGGIVYNADGRSIQNVTFRRLLADHTDNGGSAKIGRSSSTPFGGVIQNVTWEDYTVISPRAQGLFVNVFAEGGCQRPSNPNRADWLTMRDLHWSNYTVHGSAHSQPAGCVLCTPTAPCSGFTFDAVTIDGAAPYSCLNAVNATANNGTAPVPCGVAPHMPLFITVDPLARANALVVSTLLDARTALRAALAADHALNVTIMLASGTHRVPPGGLELTAADTPVHGSVVTWRGATGGAPPSIVSGGEVVTGWARSTDPTLPVGTFSAPAPPALAGRAARQLYVDGVRAPRTSQPASAVLPGLSLERRTDCPACSYAVATTAPAAWSNPRDIEFVYAGVGSSWSDSRCAVESVTQNAEPSANCSVNSVDEPDCGFISSTEEECVRNVTADHPLGCCWHPGGLAPSGHYCVAPVFPPTMSSTRITMAQPCFWNLVNRPYQPVGGDAPTSVENVREHFHAAGSWYLDRGASMVHYIPLPGQDMGTVEVILAVEEALLTLDGASRQAFEAVTFSFSTWLRPAQGEGLVDQQSAAANICPYGITMEWGCGLDDVYVMPPGNVALVGASDVDFANCTFSHLGAYATSARGGSQGISWRGCSFFDVSGGALALGDTDTYNITDAALIDTNFTVSDCSMYDTGLEFTGATTIFAAYVSNTLIEHNVIINASYSALTMGWGWGREAARRGNNSILSNHVVNAQTVRCCDGGGLYTLGPQPGSVIAGNLLSKGGGKEEGNAIYHDNGSGGFNDTGNVIDGTWGKYLFQDNSDGPYGAGAQCPGLNGPANCGMAFIGNWMRTAADGTNNHQNTSYADNEKLAPGTPLPPAAAAVAAAAGPRY